MASCTRYFFSAIRTYRRSSSLLRHRWYLIHDTQPVPYFPKRPHRFHMDGDPLPFPVFDIGAFIQLLDHLGVCRVDDHGLYSRFQESHNAAIFFFPIRTRNCLGFYRSDREDPFFTFVKIPRAQIIGVFTVFLPMRFTHFLLPP